MSGGRGNDNGNGGGGPVPGRLIAVVGPSGVGKDSVIDGLVARVAGLARARRTITRPADAGGEDFEGVTPEAFAARAAAGAFALRWEAHGLAYGIPQEELAPLAAGQDVIANLSRRALPAARATVQRLVVLALSARPETLAARLGARGRENEGEITGRLARDTGPLPAGLVVLPLANDGRLDDTLRAAKAALFGSPPAPGAGPAGKPPEQLPR